MALHEGLIVVVFPEDSFRQVSAMLWASWRGAWSEAGEVWKLEDEGRRLVVLSFCSDNDPDCVIAGADIGLLEAVKRGDAAGGVYRPARFVWKDRMIGRR